MQKLYTHPRAELCGDMRRPNVRMRAGQKLELGNACRIDLVRKFIGILHEVRAQV